jgi:hypothetical protein
MEKPVNHLFLHFGPVIGGTQVDPEITKELLKRSRKCTESHVTELAGHLDKEYSFPNEDKLWFVEKCKKYFTSYWRRLQSHKDPLCFYGIDPFKKVWLANIWVNFMQKGDFNPPHNHSGAYSFVLYLKVPKELTDEENAFKGRGTGPASIGFYYGEDQKGIKTGHALRPVENQLWIFPASLKHCVPPFKSDVERVSISGNWFVTDEGQFPAKYAKQISEEEILIND